MLERKTSRITEPATRQARLTADLRAFSLDGAWYPAPTWTATKNVAFSSSSCIWLVAAMDWLMDLNTAFCLLALLFYFWSFLMSLKFFCTFFVFCCQNCTIFVWFNGHFILFYCIFKKLDIYLFENMGYFNWYNKSFGERFEPKWRVWSTLFMSLCYA